MARGGIDYYTLNTNAILPKELQLEKDGNGTNGLSVELLLHAIQT